eukprot:TRINITY_DN60287_c0_g2_i1.p1 TRINITY_DN60287_c0_g2~~TRINITY_DN60287_c0_g2_i1.p1  ORF type:complete len:209 (+),score=49.05 TRINITY_DN60287_c0_g2_i1:102-728(+)
MIRRPPRSTLSSSSAASDVYKRQVLPEHLIAPAFHNGNLTTLSPFEVERRRDVGWREERRPQYPTESYPVLNGTWGAEGWDDLYFAGALMHGADYRVGGGSMVRGFKHMVVSLFNWLSLKRHQQPWPSVRVFEPSPNVQSAAMAGLEERLATAVLALISHEVASPAPVSYTHLRAHETPEHLVCRLLLEKKKKQKMSRYQKNGGKGKN